MGPYLAQPITDKTKAKAENQKLKLKFAKVEMQGKELLREGGGEAWRTQPLAS